MCLSQIWIECMLQTEYWVMSSPRVQPIRDRIDPELHSAFSSQPVHYRGSAWVWIPIIFYFLPVLCLSIVEFLSRTWNELCHSNGSDRYACQGFDISFILIFFSYIVFLWSKPLYWLWSRNWYLVFPLFLNLVYGMECIFLLHFVLVLQYLLVVFETQEQNLYAIIIRW